MEVTCKSLLVRKCVPSPGGGTGSQITGEKGAEPPKRAGHWTHTCFTGMLWALGLGYQVQCQPCCLPVKGVRCLTVLYFRVLVCNRGPFQPPHIFAGRLNKMTPREHQSLVIPQPAAHGAPRASHRWFAAALKFPGHSPPFSRDTKDGASATMTGACHYTSVQTPCMDTPRGNPNINCRLGETMMCHLGSSTVTKGPPQCGGRTNVGNLYYTFLSILL